MSTDVSAYSTVWEDVKRDAITVAILIGFDLVRTFDELPAGFRHNWRAAFEANVFATPKTYGEMKRAYCDWICRA